MLQNNVWGCSEDLHDIKQGDIYFTESLFSTS